MGTTVGKRLDTAHAPKKKPSHLSMAGALSNETVLIEPSFFMWFSSGERE